MPRHLLTPNLPETAVCHMLVAEFACPRLAAALAAYGVQALPAPKTMSLPYRVNDHADMNCRHLGGKELMVFRDALLHPDMNAAGLKVIRSATPAGEKYPVSHETSGIEPSLKMLPRNGLDGSNIWRPIWSPRGVISP